MILIIITDDDDTFHLLQRYLTSADVRWRGTAFYTPVEQRVIVSQSQPQTGWHFITRFPVSYHFILSRRPTPAITLNASTRHLISPR